MAERDTRIDRLLLGQEITDFLYREAELLDERRYSEWLDLLADDVRYWMPIRRNVKLGDDENEFTRAESEINWFDKAADDSANVAGGTADWGTGVKPGAARGKEVAR